MRVTTGLVTLRHQGRLYHIGTGRPHAGTRVLLLVQDLHIRIINADTGELLRELALNPDKTHQPTGRPSGWPKKTLRPLRGFAVSSMSRDITHGADDGNRTRMTSLEGWGSTIELRPHNLPASLARPRAPAHQAGRLR